MKRKYEHRPGFFGLASIAFGCAAKDGEASQRNPTLPHAHNKIETERDYEPVKNKICNQANRRRSGAGQ